MNLSHITAALFLSVSAISSATAQAQTISVNPQTLIVNFAAGENMLARIAQPAPGKAPAVTTVAATPTSGAAPAAPVAAAAAPTPAIAPAAAAAVAPAYPEPPVEVPSVIAGQRMSADAQRVTKCLIENHGDKYICGMQELNGEISKCVGGVGTAGGCFTAPLARPVAAPQPQPRPRSYPRRYYTNYVNIF